MYVVECMYTYLTGSAKTCQISPCSEIDFYIYFRRRKVLNKILLFYKPCSFRCEDTATDKQPINEAIVEFTFEARLPVVEAIFHLRISVNVITSFNNSHAIKCQ